MNLMAFPSCCGASILIGFELSWQERVYNPAKGAYETVGKKTPEAMIERIKKATAGVSGAHQVFAILNSEQRKFGWHDALLEAGFIPTRAWVNGLHNTHLLSYSLVKNPKSVLDNKYGIGTVAAKEVDHKVEIVDPFKL